MSKIISANVREIAPITQLEINNVDSSVCLQYL